MIKEAHTNELLSNMNFLCLFAFGLFYFFVVLLVCLGLFCFDFKNLDK